MNVRSESSSQALRSARARELARRRRLAQRRRGLLRLFVLVAGVSLVVGVGASLWPGGLHASGLAGSSANKGSNRPKSGIPAVEAGLEPWLLNAPLGRAVVLPADNGRSFVVAGGLLASGASAQGIYEVNPLSGAATQIGNLDAPLHDAAGIVLDGQGYVFGGGTVSPLPNAERVPSLGGKGETPTSSQARATQLPVLAQARADDSAVTIGSVGYIVGGYNGSVGDAAVLATSNGRDYRVVADLPVPVRYAAVAAVGGDIYVFGGDATTGPRAGAPTATVQMVDPLAHRATIVGAMALPIDGASAATLNGVIYVAGGETVAAGASPSSTAKEVGSIYAWSVSERRALLAGHLFAPVSHAGLAVVGSRAWLVGGEVAPGVVGSDVQMFEPNRGCGVAGNAGAGSPYYGDTLLIADRGANRLLALDDTEKVIWTYPSRKEPAPPHGFYFPDDAFFTHHGTEIISNQEANETVVQLGYPSGKVLWSYGHAQQPGSAPGYLDNPDDAYVLKNGDVTVADPKNCRVLVLSSTGKTLTQIGTPGACTHNPPHELGSPNGDTPLSDGNLLVSEINGSWIDEYTVSGNLVWATRLAIGYPSDPQPIGPNKYLVANYENPGAFIEFNRYGKILYRYGPTSGTGELNQPSLVELLPSGVLMSNDDYNDRMVAIDPATGALVWQYGKTGVPGTAPGMLDIPDGFDLLGPHGTFPTHPATG
ncbi:MAG: PQQ-binding-like beta-propeller repeat protein [Acidimicrobiales bacterium]